MTYEPLHHKYRPQTFADLVGQDAIATTLTNAIDRRRIVPAYLFTGPRGTGKTSSARILAKSLNCLSANEPTATPCGTCAVCRGIANGSTLDVIEIDAASNTGVDNIRELIERAQFAPVQCRYKVYVIDECLTGDSWVQTVEGLVRIDNPSLKGKRVLSYNEKSETWEYKKVLRWLDKGDRKIRVIKTKNSEIRCTGNHLLRTETGWIQAKDIKEGMKILSPSYNPIQKPSQVNFTTASPWTLKSPENGWQIFNNIPSLQWNTSLETVVSVEADGVAKVYDIEVEDNHNFVANGLLVHNCHMLSVAAFNALLKTLEEPPERVVFVLATTDPQRVLPTIISRCQRFDFRRIPLEPMVQHLHIIAQKEQIPITLEAVKMVAQIAQGGLRDAESLLDQLSLLAGEIDVEQVWDLVGAVPERDLLQLLKAIASENSTTVIDSVRQLLNRGREPLIVLQNLAEFYRDLLIAKTAPQRSDLVKLTQPTWEELCQFAHHWEIHTILAAQKHLRESETQIKNTTQPRLWLEIILLGLLPSALRQSTDTFSTQTSPQPRTISQPFVSPSSPPKNSPSPTPLPSPEPPPQPSEKPVVQPSPTVAHQPSEPSPKIPENHPEETTTPSFSADTENYDLEEIWRRVLEQVQPFGTQQLLRQHGRLLSMNTEVADIGFPTQALYKIAKGKIPHMEAAFQRVFNHPVKVHLEVGTQKKNTFPKASSPQPTENKQIENKPTISPEPVVNPVQENPQPDEPSPTTHQPEFPVEPQFKTPTSPVEQSPEPREIPSQNPPLLSHQETTTPDHLEEDRVAVASRRLAEVFDGKVVKLSVQKDGGGLNHFSRVTAEERSTFEPIVDPEKDKNDEEDIPF